MSLGIVTPQILQDVGAKIVWRVQGSKRVHMSREYDSAKSMISHMEKPRTVITLLPESMQESEKMLKSIVEDMGPLDVILDCVVDSTNKVKHRSMYCRENSTQYMSIDFVNDGIFVAGTRIAYLENKNLLRKINNRIYYTGSIEEV